MKEKRILTYNDIIQKLKENADVSAISGMAKVGITPDRDYGVKIPVLRSIAKEAGYNSKLAKKLWKNDTRETRILACMIEDPKLITEEQMEVWVKEFDYWEICDQCCMNLFRKTQFAYQKCYDWTKREEEYVKRAGFAIMAFITAFDKNADEDELIKFLQIIKREANDERNMVKKAVNWALRQIGKRNLYLNEKVLKTAYEINVFESKSAKWIASDAIRELTSEVVQKRLKERN